MSEKNKVFVVRFEFSPEEYKRMRAQYPDSDLREILYEGGIGELGLMLDSRETPIV